MSEAKRGQIRWADLRAPRGSEPGYRRPILVIQADSFNRSSIQTVLVAVITGNVRLANAPGNVLLRAKATGLPSDSVVNVSQLLTLDRSYLGEALASIGPKLQREVDLGLRRVLDLN